MISLENVLIKHIMLENSRVKMSQADPSQAFCFPRNPPCVSWSGGRVRDSSRGGWVFIHIYMYLFAVTVIEEESCTTRVGVQREAEGRL